VATCSNTTSWNCRWLAYQQYRFNKSLDRQAYISLRRANYSDSGNRYATCLLNARNAADALLKPILRLQDEFHNAPLEVSEWKNLNLRHAAFTQYDTSVNPVGFVYPGKTQRLYLQALSSTFANAGVSGNSIARDSRYQDEQTFMFRKGNPQQVTAHDGIATAFIWDYNNTQPIAKVTNATVDQVACTSFEADGSGSWTIPSGLRDGGRVITGSKCYNLTNGACSRSGLTSSATYIVSYWSKTGSNYTVGGSTSVKQGKTMYGWTYFEHTVTGVTSTSVSGANDIDELRLYPSTAQMLTYTYSPLVGMTDQCDADNRISYYAYDKFGRLLRISDMDGNILKQYDYQYQQYATTAAVWQATSQLRCKPCPANASYITNMQQHQEKDVNPSSATYSTLRWIDDGVPGTCVINPDWQNTATAVRCQQSAGSNTGYQEQEQKDLNPCSSSYNQTRWVVTVLNATACPFCNATNCAGNNHKCFGTTCQTGTMGVISIVQTGSGTTLKCTTQYGYFFSDGSYIYDHSVVVSGYCP
jgi:YD repeat-containing protein